MRLVHETRPKLGSYLDRTKLQSFADSIDVDARHESAHPELDVPTMVVNLLALEESDFVRFGTEGQDSFLCRLLFATWGTGATALYLKNGEEALGTRAMSQGQAERFGSLVPNYWV